MEDKAIASEIKRLAKELNSAIAQAVEENKLRVRVSSYPLRQIGTKEQIYKVEAYIYKEV